MDSLFATRMDTHDTNTGTAGTTGKATTGTTGTTGISGPQEQTTVKATTASGSGSTGASGSTGKATASGFGSTTDTTERERLLKLALPQAHRVATHPALEQLALLISPMKSLQPDLELVPLRELLLQS
jgi:hypothetical protein